MDEPDLGGQHDRVHAPHVARRAPLRRDRASPAHAPSDSKGSLVPDARPQVLTTIKSTDDAQRWLKQSFLYVRVSQNPPFYLKSLGPTAVGSAPSQALERFVSVGARSLGLEHLTRSARLTLAHPISLRTPSRISRRPG